jgi:mRNA interferase MazF
MPRFSRNEIILVRYPFSGLTSAKVRPAIVVGQGHTTSDLLIVPLTSNTTNLARDEFGLADWSSSGLNVPSAVKRSLYTVHSVLVAKSIGTLSRADALKLDTSLRAWLNLV